MIKFTYCKNFASAETKEVDWDAFARPLTRSVEFPSKEASVKRGAFIGGVREDESRGREANVRWRTVATIDYDALAVGIDEVEFALQLSLDCAFVAYSTFRHAPDAPRVRLCVPLERPVSEGEYGAVVDEIVRTVGLGVPDKCSYVMNQLMFLPSHRPGVEPWSLRNDGAAWPVGEAVKGVHIEHTPDADADADDAEDDGDDLMRLVAAQPLDITEGEVDAALEGYEAEGLDYDAWLRVGMALYHQFQGDDDGWRRWLAWSEKSAKHDPRQMRTKWRSFGSGSRERPVTFASVIKLAGGLRQISGASLSSSGTALVQTQFPIANHPLLKFTPYDGTLKAPRMIVPGLIEHGTCVIAGQAGVGKTTAIIALACTVAGIHKPHDPLKPPHWRHVVFISEDTNQVKRSLFAIEEELGFHREICERIHIVEAVRMAITNFVKVGQPYDELFTRDVEGVKIPPLVICDTKAAIFAATDENDNAETSAMMAGLKQEFSGLPVWVIGHVSKSNMNRNSASDITLRGASSAEGDANQTMFLIKDYNDRRFLVLGKTRFEPEWRDVELRPFTSTSVTANDFGDPVATVLRRVELSPLTEACKAERAEVAKAEREATKRRGDEEKKVAIKIWATDLIKDRRIGQDPLNRTALKNEMLKKFAIGTTLAFKLITEWVDEGIFGEVQIPAELAANNNKRKFLIELTETEGAEWIRSKAPPPEKSTIPDSWMKRKKQQK